MSSFLSSAILTVALAGMVCSLPGLSSNAERVRAVVRARRPENSRRVAAKD
ncbi:hypothetical protein [Methylocapsa palsarum]|uniref:Uncharacterized protein n=1 Tax=Methylocapsa palsarum TaxID=1612308 RepID=A0A1I3WQZ0_9HYPH|nr:hypothetical protein [Methylocapsa palsarum]SFK09599.1 hypothetical protein SAMN05444581_10254 [Methylocapsa palsarum]